MNIFVSIETERFWEVDVAQFGRRLGVLRLSQPASMEQNQCCMLGVRNTTHFPQYDFLATVFLLFVSLCICGIMMQTTRRTSQQHCICFPGHIPLCIIPPSFWYKNRRSRVAARELKPFLEVKSFLLTRVCHKICLSTQAANSNKNIIKWLPILLNNCLVERKGEEMGVPVLPCTCVTPGQECFLNFFPCLRGLSNSQLHSVLLHHPHFHCSYLTLFGCALHEHRGRRKPQPVAAVSVSCCGKKKVSFCSTVINCLPTRTQKTASGFQGGT